MKVPEVITELWHLSPNRANTSHVRTTTLQRGSLHNQPSSSACRVVRVHAYVSTWLEERASSVSGQQEPTEAEC